MFPREAGSRSGLAGSRGLRAELPVLVPPGSRERGQGLPFQQTRVDESAQISARNSLSPTPSSTPRHRDSQAILPRPRKPLHPPRHLLRGCLGNGLSLGTGELCEAISSPLMRRSWSQGNHCANCSLLIEDDIGIPGYGTVSNQS